MLLVCAGERRNAVRSIAIMAYSKLLGEEPTRIAWRIGSAARNAD
jgi:hypothetical protein